MQKEKDLVGHTTLHRPEKKGAQVRKYTVVRKTLYLSIKSQTETQLINHYQMPTFCFGIFLLICKIFV